MVCAGPPNEMDHFIHRRTPGASKSSARDGNVLRGRHDLMRHARHMRHCRVTPLLHTTLKARNLHCSACEHDQHPTALAQQSKLNKAPRTGAPYLTTLPQTTRVSLTINVTGTSTVSQPGGMLIQCRPSFPCASELEHLRWRVGNNGSAARLGIKRRETLDMGTQHGRVCMCSNLSVFIQ